MWWADTANDILKQRNGANSAWISILTLSTGAPLAGMSDIVDDTTPQLGGDLDLNGNDITGTGAIPSANLSGALPAIDGSALTGINPSFGRVVRTSGHVTTTSTSLVDVTGATVTITTGAFPVAYGNVTSARNNTPGALLYINIDIDGALEYGTSGTQRHVINNNYMFNASTSGQSAALTAGSHTIKMQWKVSAGSGLLWADDSNSHQFYAREIR
jgi:hypothetical protein